MVMPWVALSSAVPVVTTRSDMISTTTSLTPSHLGEVYPLPGSNTVNLPSPCSCRILHSCRATSSGFGLCGIRNFNP